MSVNQTATSRRAIILGSTGSIGVNTLRVVENLNGRYQIVGLAANASAEELIGQAERFGVDHLALADPDAAALVRTRLPDAHLFQGPDAALQLVESVDAEIIVAAMVGSAGLPATLAGIRKHCDIALANKETLVAAGELVMPLAREYGVNLLPIDSEHSAIFQCMDACQHAREDGRAVKKIVLTASGGPFRTASKDQIENATVEQALNHPTWNMGRKITIDSATMMNKALEIIEAHWLFGLSAEQIEVIVHPQSIVHSFVEFTDNSVLAQLGPPDMKTPIQYAMTYPQRTSGCSDEMDWSSLRQLDFQPPDFERFPALSLAYRVIRSGGTSGAIFNAANEAAVAAFLDGRIPFGRITRLVEQTLDKIEMTQVHDLQTVLTADRQARESVRELLR